MAAHAKESSALAAWGYRAMGALLALVVFAVGCIAGYQAKDSFGVEPFWLIYGGNTDPGDGQGNGAARDQMIAGGWTTPENSYQIQWEANLGSGNNDQVNQAMPQGHDAYARFCGHGCIIAGFSWGTSPALQLAAETGTPPQNNYLFGGPQPSTGVWHSPYVDNPFIEPWIRFFPPDPNRFVPAGTQVFYDTRDPYANAAPQCGGPGLFLLNVQTGHYIINRAQANEHIWTGSDGAVMHEAGYQAAPFGLPRSGSDPQQPWDFCPPNFPAFNIPAMNGDPGVPALPGVPTR
jgi:hypothetical protein